MDRAPGLSVRLKLTLSYAGFLMLASALLLAAVWVSLLRYIPDEVTYGLPWFPPNRSDPLNGFGLPGGHRAGVPAGVRSRWEGGSSPAGCSPP